MLFFAGISHAAQHYSDCLGKLLQQDNGAWVQWGNASLGDLAGLQALGDYSRPRRQKALDTRFATQVDPSRKATRIYCRIGSGASHAALSDGALVGWGPNTFGEIGNGTQTASTQPQELASVRNVVSLGTGGQHRVAATAGGTVWAWGRNAEGQVGNGTTSLVQVAPVQVSGLTDVTAVAAGSLHSVALLSSGVVRTWGMNNAGQLGDGSTSNRSSPVNVNGLTGVVAIAAGQSTTVALKSDGSVWTWGEKTFEAGNATTPVAVPSVASVVAIAASPGRTFYALTSSGAVWGWGDNPGNALGEARTACFVNCAPAQITGLPSSVAQVFAGPSYALARTTDGKIYGWGSNAQRELGLGFPASGSALSYATPQLMRQGAAHSDFDLDYSSDILFRGGNGDQVFYVWNMRELAIAHLGFIVDAGFNLIVSVSNNWQIVGIGDANGDGKDDLFWRNAVTGENSVWFMDNHQFAGTIPISTVSDSSWKVAAIADLDGDGLSDILWRNENAGLFAVWLVGASGIKETRAYGGIPAAWEIRGAADFTGDRKADIIWRNRDDGAVAIYRMNGTALDGVSFLAGVPTQWDIVNVSDLDRDGYAEILFRFETGAALVVWQLNSAGTTVDSFQIFGGPGAQWQLAAVGDYDADTHSDLLWRNNATGDIVIWRMVDLGFQGSAWLGNPGGSWQIFAK